MIKILCSAYEKQDFIRTLEYAKEKKEEDFKKGRMKEKRLQYELNIIDKLIDRVLGKCQEDYYNMSSKLSREKAVKCDTSEYESK